MDDHRPLLHPQFSLRSLFVATTMCAAAFAVLAQSELPELLVAFAACVPLFWLGVAWIIVGDGVRSRNLPLLNIPAELLSAVGAYLAASAVVSALIVVILGGFLFVLNLAGVTR
jgi:hypothetical protein